MPKKIAIIGGTKGFGFWLADFIKNHFPNEEIIITGTSENIGNENSSKIGVKFSSNNKKTISESDIIIFSVPIDKTEKVILENIEFVKENSVIADVTSIKEIPAKALKTCKAKNITIIPTHPMFGPFVKSLAGQVIILTPENSEKEKIAYKFLKEFLESQNAKIVEVSPEYHDKMMSVVQGLTHLNLLVFGKTVEKLGFDIKESYHFISPIYKLILSSVSRYLGQSAGLYADIQMNNLNIPNVHKSYLESLKEFSKISKEKNREEFISYVESSTEYFGKETCKDGQKYTDKIIFMNSLQIDLIKLNLGKIFKITNIYTKESFLSKVIGIEREEVSLENNEKINLNENYFETANI